MSEGTEAAVPPPVAPDAPPPAPATLLSTELTRRGEALAPIYALTGRVLAWSFRVGAGLLLLGVLLAAVKGEPLDHEVDPPAAVLPTLLAGRAAGVVDLAILWLMAAPVFATIAVAVGFARFGDRRYALLSLAVLAVLAVSIALALGRS